jgi:hypothetical protein
VIACHSAVWSASNISRTTHCLTVRLSASSNPMLWWLTVVYGPHQDHEKLEFIAELRSIRSGLVGPWVLCDDFNMIYRAADKSNGHLNRCLMGAFCRLVQDLELEELHLIGAPLHMEQ